MFAHVDADLLRVWVRTAVAALGEARDEIDALNVFPVPDGDTGTNMYLTLAAAGRAMADADPGTDPAAGDPPDGGESGDAGAAAPPEPSDAGAAAQMAVLSQALVQGALLGARGNSGVILSQILRGMVRVAPITEGGGLRPAAQAITIGLRRGADMAYSAVADPKEGTMLTVIRRAAEGAAAAQSEDLPTVVRAAAAAAEDALAHTTEQLEALRRAGVVDSGGAGIVVILSALREVITGERPPPAAQHQAPPLPTEPDRGYTGPSYEVMYLLEADDDEVPALKGRLAELGDSLLVVGGDRLWNIHVHVDDAGAAVEAGIAAGRPYRIRITWLIDGAQHHQPVTGRTVVAVTHGPGIADLLTGMGVTALPAQPALAPTTGELLEAVLGGGAGEAIILPGDSDIRASAEAAAVAARRQGLRVAVVPSRSVVQSLAAVAVHDADLAFDDDVVGMSRAAAATRYGAVTVSTKEAMTTAGRCHPGDVLGVVDGDILAIGSDLVAVATRTFDLLLSSGGELATIVTGTDADERLVAAVTDHLARNHPAVDTTVYEGGQPLWPLIFGVE